mmetsp:Transcript_15219/g.21367  ORF Transcript_15219/g.21367 Transcript_15219/m.21367 type:complete len:550 (-) Transcript_15219:178-1827(-)
MRGTNRRLLLVFISLALALSGVVTQATSPSESTPTSGGAQTSGVSQERPNTIDSASGASSKKLGDDVINNSSSPKIEYVVGLYTKPDGDEGAEIATRARGRTVEMTSKNGQKFACVLPDPDAAEEDNNAAKSAGKDMLVRGIQTAFKKRCLVKNAGYWSYEVCPFKKIVQFHGEPGGARDKRVSFSLGQYLADLDEAPALGEDNLSDGDLTPETKQIREALPVESNSVPYAQRYVGGTSGRKAVVQFVCHRRAGFDGNFGEILKVEEPSEFHYKITIATPRACLNEPENRAKQPVPRLLSPLKDRCIYMNQGWWNYEFCFNAHVRQYHMETVSTPVTTAEKGEKETEKGKSKANSKSQVTKAQSGKVQKTTTNTVTTADFLLGRRTSNSTISVHKGDSPATSYASQSYSDGTTCDLTGNSRRTEVRFVCEEELQKSRIVSIQESYTCEYLMHVATPLICVHETFQPVQPKLLEIACHPIDVSDATGEAEAATTTVASPASDSEANHRDTDKAAKPADDEILENEDQGGAAKLNAEDASSGPEDMVHPIP